MKIIYFGCDPFVSCFERILREGHEIVTLFTFHNEHDWIHEEQLVRVARSYNIPVRYDLITLEEADNLFVFGGCDLFFSAEYNKLIPIPECTNFKGLNIHNTLLPEGRGFFPVETQLFLRKSYGGVTIHKLTPHMDEGEVLYSKRFTIPFGAGVKDVYATCADIAENAVGPLLSNLDTAWENAHPQTGQISYWSPTIKERTIVPDMDVGEAEHLWRCYMKFTYVRIENTLYRVLGLRVVEDSVCLRRTFQWLAPDSVSVQLKEGVVCLEVERK